MQLLSEYITHEKEIRLLVDFLCFQLMQFMTLPISRPKKQLQ